MRYYPIFADIKGRPVVVVGGGEVAFRKVKSLLDAGASVTVISPEAAKGLENLKDRGKIHIIKRKYRKGDLKGAFLAVSASDDKEVNNAVYREAEGSNKLVNVVDDPAHCNFIVPSVVDRGSLVIAISTSGKAPFLAKRLRQDLEKHIGAEYGVLAELLGEVRKNLLKTGVTRVKKERVIKDLLNSPLLGWIRGGEARKIDGLLEKLLGEGYGLKGLGVKIKETGAAPKGRSLKKVKE